jgi:hypothetical protein
LWSQWIDIFGVLIFARRAGFGWDALGLRWSKGRLAWAIFVTVFCYVGGAILNLVLAGMKLRFKNLRPFYTDPGIEEFGFGPFGSPILMLYAIFWSVLFYGLVLETFRSYMYATLYLLFHQNWRCGVVTSFVATIATFGALHLALFNGPSYLRTGQGPLSYLVTFYFFWITGLFFLAGRNTYINGLLHGVAEGAPDLLIGYRSAVGSSHEPLPFGFVLPWLAALLFRKSILRDGVVRNDELIEVRLRASA